MGAAVPPSQPCIWTAFRGLRPASSAAYGNGSATTSHTGGSWCSIAVDCAAPGGPCSNAASSRACCYGANGLSPSNANVRHAPDDGHAADGHAPDGGYAPDDGWHAADADAAPDDGASADDDAGAAATGAACQARNPRNVHLARAGSSCRCAAGGRGCEGLVMRW